MDSEFLKRRANEIRLEILQVVEKTGAGHIASSFSCVEILTTLFYGNIMKFDAKNPKWEGRDRFLLSKGHASSAFYCVLGDLGYFDKKELETFAQKGSNFGVHLQHSVPGAEIMSGSLGAGFGIGCGMAYADKMDRNTRLTFVLMGDAECYEGSVWESAMFAAHNNLNNLIVIIDHNHMGCTDFIENSIRMESYEEKFKSFGFDTITVNGHEPCEIINALSGIRSRRSSKPLIIIADTVKAKGLKDVENTLLCHVYMPNNNKIHDNINEINSLLKGVE